MMTKRSAIRALQASLPKAEPPTRSKAGSAREAEPMPDESIIKARFDAIMAAADRCGLLEEKTSRIGGRVSASLVAQAKQRTGIPG